MVDKNQKQQSGVPKSDSGYASLGRQSPPQEMIAAVEASTIRHFKELIDTLNKIECQLPLDVGIEYSLKEYNNVSEKQEMFFKEYLKAYIAPNDQEKKKERHFTILDRAIENRYPKSGLPDNEGAAFFAILRSCSNKEIIEKTIEIISIEKSKDPSELIKKYIDKEGCNILHYLADLIVSKVDYGLPIEKKDWAAYQHYATLYPELTTQVDTSGRLPEAISEELLGLNVAEEVYAFGKPTCTFL